ncbi:hypothetical protein S7711_01492 [Stachybotrys chartarum IBT 7711]|uniref:Uncharacterized protein n=1 Tax=Stachybotrys chartarum (strain CBS 109288 / IBT 7711) TaxID=1280523 RepID=A0A084B750_STACB|nr:hypothetical protein S7711_01492 [Stachybotrys chartarum IBT 7711]KFA80280.1 hypothetical protein S40288_10249 [Stachybotrys chartarum IBT 40288]
MASIAILATTAAVTAAGEDGVNLDITLNNSQPEQDADSTIRPDVEPTNNVGTQFKPLNVPDRPFKVLDLSESPLKLFPRFLPIQLVKDWVTYANLAAVDPKDPALKDNSRQRRWKPISLTEIYIWKGTSICMDLQPDKQRKDYWRASYSGGNHSPS